LFDRLNLYSSLAINEPNFNHVLIWPLVELAVSNMKEFIFIPGEYTLKSSEEEYKADAAVIYNYLEITLLETSGIFELHAIHRFRDNAIFGYDHVKGTFGCLCLFNCVLKTYYYATEESVYKLQISFIHARVTVPENKEDTQNILAMGNFVWLLKVREENINIS
ncbi:hypothetical protein EDC94DRAFT_523503, partial [Helicostylum pulchrum]